MMIPMTIKIGKTKYPVLQPEMMTPPDHFGHVVCGKHIKVAYSWVENNRTKHRSERQRSETFWHEVTHAILHHELLFEHLVVLVLLRCHGHFTRHCDDWRQVEALRFCETYCWLQRCIHRGRGVRLCCPLEHGQFVHHLVAPRCEELGHATGVHQLGQAVRIHG